MSCFFFFSEGKLCFLSLDVFALQITTSIQAEFKKLNYTYSYIPGGCTGFIQVLDITLNKFLKILIA
jgi:hypothetical protein